MENASEYTLKKKYNGISLKFGSSVMVTNINITNEYAKELLKRFSAEHIFDKFPKEIPQEIETIEVQEITVEATEKPLKSKRKRINKNR